MRWIRTQLTAEDVVYYVESDIDMVVEEVKAIIDEDYDVDLDLYPDWFGGLIFEESEYYVKVKNNMISDFLHTYHYDDDMSYLFEELYDKAEFYVRALLSTLEGVI